METMYGNLLSCWCYLISDFSFKKFQFWLLCAVALICLDVIIIYNLLLHSVCMLGCLICATWIARSFLFLLVAKFLVLFVGGVGWFLQNKFTISIKLVKTWINSEIKKGLIVSEFTNLWMALSYLFYNIYGWSFSLSPSLILGVKDLNGGSNSQVVNYSHSCFSYCRW